MVLTIFRRVAVIDLERGLTKLTRTGANTEYIHFCMARPRKAQKVVAGELLVVVLLVARLTRFCAYLVYITYLILWNSSFPCFENIPRQQRKEDSDSERKTKPKVTPRLRVGHGHGSLRPTSSWTKSCCCPKQMSQTMTGGWHCKPPNTKNEIQVRLRLLNKLVTIFIPHVYFYFHFLTHVYFYTLTHSRFDSYSSMTRCYSNDS